MSKCIGLGGAALVLTVWVGLDGELAARPRAHLSILCAAGVLWAVALGLSRSTRVSQRGLGTILVLAALARLALLTGDPRTSDDLARYLWEGELVLEGTSPYAFAPDAPELTRARSDRADLHSRLNNPHMSAIYPPLAQVVFAAGVRISGASERGLRVLFALADMAVLVPLLALARRRGIELRAAIAWACCPLVLLEFAGAGHLDALAIFFLVWALAAADAGRERTSAVALALGGLGKLVPLLALPAILRGARRPWRSFALVALVAALGYVPLALFDGGLRGAFLSLGEYGFRWESFNLLHRFVEDALASAFAYDEGASDPRRLARALGAAVLLGCMLWAWLERLAPPDAAAIAVGAFLVLTPTLHPWYLTWMVPFIGLGRSGAWIFLIVLAPLLYAPLAGWQREGIWVEPRWLWPALGLPFLVWLAWEARVRLASRGEPRP